MSCTTAVMLQDRLNDIERNICDGIDFRQELNEAYVLADELKSENAKLRELVRDWYELAVGGADSLTDWNHAQADLEDRMRELEVEVDG